MQQLIVLSLLLVCIYSAYNTEQNKPWNVNVNTQFKPTEYYGEYPNHKYYPSPKDWRTESIYQFITDRFGDGDPKNNDGKYGGYNLHDVGYRHGGDFLGAAKKMDYIKSLGYTSIWISPIFQNQQNSYHGYAQVDFTLLDDRFGTVEDLRLLVQEAHKRDIKVIVDIVVNHMADLFYFEGHPSGETPFRMHTGEYNFLPRDPNNIYADFIVNNTWFSDGQYCDVYGYDGYVYQDTHGSGSFWESDFHHNGDLQNYGDVWMNHLGKIYGIMDDLRTTHPRVQNKIIAMTQSLIASTDIDGIRMDTPMQVPLYFFQRWIPAVKEYAKKLGKDNFFIFGEFFCPRERASTMVGRGRTPNQYGKQEFITPNIRTFDSGIHYPIFWWFEEAIKKHDTKTLDGLTQLFKSDQPIYDFYNPLNNQTEYLHLVFYSNHDQWRMSTTQDGFNRTDLSSAIIALWPGIPAFYYGDEQGFLTKGTGLDGWAREDFMTSLAWRNLPTVDGHNPADFDNFDMTNPHFVWNQKLMNVRRVYKNLHACDDVQERWRQTQNSNGIYAYSRACGNKDDHVLVVWNTWREPLVAGGSLGDFFTGWDTGDQIANVLSNNNYEKYTLLENGKLESLVVPGYVAKVFVKVQSIKPLDPAVRFINPTHDSVTTQNAKFTLVFNLNDIDMNTVDLKLNGNSIKYQVEEQNRIITFVVNATVGVNFLSLENVKSSSGTVMQGKFISRFRVGDQDNVIINPKFTNDPNMVTVQDGAAVITHKAIGAELMRVQVEGSAWSEWVPFAKTSTVPADKGKRVTAQYYVDNSAAYFVTGMIN